MRGSEDTLVEQGEDGFGRGDGEFGRMEMGMVPMGAMGAMGRLVAPVAAARPIVYARGSDEGAPPPAYESRPDGRGAGAVMEAAYLPGRQ